MTPFSPLAPPARLLLGPGPSEVAPSVALAMAKPMVGHLDPAFLTAMDETRVMLRAVFGTHNELTLPMSGTGSFGMETCFVNLVEPGDRVLVGAHGAFGARMAEVARRAGAHVDIVASPYGSPLDYDALRARAKDGYAIVAAVHGETSTGVLADLSVLREIADAAGALLLIDAVTSLGGVAVDVDRHRVDAIYSGTQKCLSCPPGLSPVSFSSAARERMSKRKHLVQSWYADLGLIAKYWGEDRAYHHTAPIPMIYALHEALRLVLEEGLEQRYARHARNAAALAAGLEALGLPLVVEREHRLPPLTIVRAPEGVDEAGLRRHLLERFGIEVGGCLGDLKGKAFRIGLMGHSARPESIARCLTALADALAVQGVSCDASPAIETALRVAGPLTNR